MGTFSFAFFAILPIPLTSPWHLLASWAFQRVWHFCKLHRLAALGVCSSSGFGLYPHTYPQIHGMQRYIPEHCGRTIPRIMPDFIGLSRPSRILSYKVMAVESQNGEECFPSAITANFLLSHVMTKSGR